MTQLRHMVNAMRSGKADVEHEQNILFAVNLR
jgi:hypothetical protein